MRCFGPDFSLDRAVPALFNNFIVALRAWRDAGVLAWLIFFFSFCMAMNELVKIGI